MESCYTLALKELERIRLENKSIAAARLKEVESKIPEIREIEDSLMRSGTALLRCVLDKSENFETIKESIRSLQKKKQALLEKSGYDRDYLEEIASCKICSDTGFTDDGRRCACHKMLILKYMGENSNMTKAMLSQTFENFDMTIFKNQSVKSPGDVLKVMSKVYEKAIAFSESFDKTGENLFIMGGAGTGKTFLSSCIANKALERKKSVYYQSSFKLFEMFEGAKFHGSTDDAEAIKYVYDVDLLIIDDIGTEFITQYTAAIFFDIINSRANSNKSTIITTNLDFEGLDASYSTRLTSRILGDFTVLQTIGQDIRRIRK